jgi:hypothetical protein
VRVPLELHWTRQVTRPAHEPPVEPADSSRIGQSDHQRQLVPGCGQGRGHAGASAPSS